MGNGRADTQRLKPVVAVVPAGHDSWGGPAAFVRIIVPGLEKKGFNVVVGPYTGRVDSVLVLGGTRHLGWLVRQRAQGAVIVHRLDGMNWIHRVVKLDLNYRLRCEITNYLMLAIRNFADRIVYQSAFCKKWWRSRFGAAQGEELTVHNGVDLATFKPNGKWTDRWESETRRILVVEGSLRKYPYLLDCAIDLAAGLREHTSKKVELVIAGPVPSNWAPPGDPQWVKLLGPVDKLRILNLMQSAHLLFSAIINPACPNSVLEAMACGLPVAGFINGALAELVGDEGGVLVPYGADPWRLQKPTTTELLVSKVASLWEDGPKASMRARRRAEKFSAESTISAYSAILSP